MGWIGHALAADGQLREACREARGDDHRPWQHCAGGRNQWSLREHPLAGDTSFGQWRTIHYLHSRCPWRRWFVLSCLGRHFER